MSFLTSTLLIPSPIPLEKGTERMAVWGLVAVWR